MRSRDAADIIGISYRQLNWLCETIPEALAPHIGETAPGSGNRREWPDYVVIRLAVARQIGDALPWTDEPGSSRFPHVAVLVMGTDVEPLVPHGWAWVYAHGRRVSYGLNPVVPLNAALVVRYDVTGVLKAITDVHEAEVAQRIADRALAALQTT